MVHTVTTKYASYVDTRVYVDIGYGEWEVDVEDIVLDLKTGEMEGMAYCPQREIELWIGDTDCRNALTKYEEENI